MTAKLANSVVLVAMVGVRDVNVHFGRFVFVFWGVIAVVGFLLMVMERIRSEGRTGQNRRQ